MIGGLEKRQLRNVLKKRQNNHCAYCQYPMKKATSTSRRRATIDHVVPRSKGGSDDVGNLLLVCWLCNSQKADKMMFDVSGKTVVVDPTTSVISVDQWGGA